MVYRLDGEYGNYDYRFYREEEDLKDSMKQSIANKQERLEKELKVKNMIRPYTTEEENILRQGLKASEVVEDIGDRIEEDIKHILGNN